MKKKEDEELEMLEYPLEDPDEFESMIHPEDNIEEDDEERDEREELEGLFSQE